MSKSLLDRLENSVIERLGVRIADAIADGDFIGAEKLKNYAVGVCFAVAEDGIGFADFDPDEIEKTKFRIGDDGKLRAYREAY